MLVLGSLLKTRRRNVHSPIRSLMLKKVRLRLAITAEMIKAGIEYLWLYDYLVDEPKRNS
jgi:hypothetical protein